MRFMPRAAARRKNAGLKIISRIIRLSGAKSKKKRRNEARAGAAARKRLELQRKQPNIAAGVKAAAAAVK